MRRRAYSVVAENVKARPEAQSVMTKVVDTSKKNANVNTNSNSNVGKAGGSVESGGGVAKDVFWMKDPKTGNWLPETHFNQVDAVELREKLLSKPSSIS